MIKLIEELINDLERIYQHLDSYRFENIFNQILEKLQQHNFSEDIEEVIRNEFSTLITNLDETEEIQFLLDDKKKAEKAIRGKLETSHNKILSKQGLKYLSWFSKEYDTYMNERMEIVG